MRTVHEPYVWDSFVTDPAVPLGNHARYNGIPFNLLSPENLAEAKQIRLASGTFMPLEDILGKDTEPMRDFYLGLQDNPKLTALENSYVLLSRFPEVRTDHVPYVFDAWTYWLHNKVPDVGALASGKHLGTVGERIELKVNVTRINGPFASEYGDSYLCVMETEEDKDRVVWWTGENLSFEEGHPYSIKGTVKKHDEYDGSKQTHLTRVKEIKA